VVTVTDFSKDPVFLRARVSELEMALADLRGRLIALARVLPPDYVSLLNGDAAAVEAGAPSWSIFDGWQDTIAIKPSHVEPEMKRLWARLDPAAGDGPTR